ncbi:hypothetical protein [Flavobacterium urocaniciphilum]|uniref:Lipoprotein n=1 Tax=Flavobacterium urocaniciphilum TaxID=1299341 RepID=A0A1H8YSY0_9FLAO|nr:hypothetical protein [Flavobacterium urocaniciphilum]SEP55305.1 hypothetical protein SAMN05444005_101173 [Flavobacterium urocaniciphilum]
MKKLSYIFILIALVSCDYILKSPATADDEFVLDSIVKNQVNDDENKNGCDLKAGYKWSNMTKKCVRVFDEGYRLTSIEKDSLGKGKNAYFFIDEDSLEAEIFLPDSKESIIFKREDENENFKYQNFVFKIKKGYNLYYNNKLLFQPANPVDLKVVGSDEDH